MDKSVVFIEDFIRGWRQWNATIYLVRERKLESGGEWKRKKFWNAEAWLCFYYVTNS